MLIGQPRDVGSAIPRQCALGSADIGARSGKISPRRHGLSSSGAKTAHMKKGGLMEELPFYSDVTAAELASDYLNHRDQEVLQGLVAAGALVGALGRLARRSRAEGVDKFRRSTRICANILTTRDRRSLGSRRATNSLRRLAPRCGSASSVGRPVFGIDSRSHRRAGRSRGSKNSSQRVADTQDDTAGYDDFAAAAAGRLKSFAIPVMSLAP